jgi:predicted metal-dependent hydrolase
MMEIEIGGVKVRINKKAIKNIHLSVHPPEGKVTIACPEATKDETIRLYLASKIGWIKRQQKLLQGKDRQSPRKYVTGETHYLLGKAYRLKVVPAEGKSGVRVKGKTVIELTVQKESTTEAKSELLREFYRSQLKTLLTKMVDDWCRKMEVMPEDWRVKAMKTKWGSCNTEKRTLLFNLELAKKPKTCVEYIVVHELVHLLERLHNDRFVSYMDRFLPMWRRRKEELNSLPVAHSDWEY